MSSILGTALMGLNRATAGVQNASSRIAAFAAQSPEETETSQSAADGDLVSDIVDLKRYDVAFRASATLVDFEDRRLGELLDLIG